MALPRFERSQESMGDGTTAWMDRNYQYFNVPEQLVCGALLRGPHKSVPKGTRLRVRLLQHGGCCAVYVLGCPDGRDGGFGESLPGSGWTEEEAAPSFAGSEARGALRDVRRICGFNLPFALGVPKLRYPPGRG